MRAISMEVAGAHAADAAKHAADAAKHAADAAKHAADAAKRAADAAKHAAAAGAKPVADAKKIRQFFIKLTDFSIIIQYSIWVIAVALRNPKLAFVGNGRRSAQGVCKGNGARCASELVNGEYPWKYHASALEPKNNIHLKFLYRPLSHGGFP